MAHYKKPSRIWIVIMAILITLLSAGCLVNQTNSTKIDAFSHECLNSLMGKEKEVVFDTLNIDPQQDTLLGVKDRFQETYTLRDPLKVDGKESTIVITFWNDFMLSYNYTFSSIQDGFEYAKRIRDKMGKAYGKPTRYPYRILGNEFDNIDSIQDIDINANPDFMYWFEEWELGNSNDLIERLLDGIESHEIISQPQELKIKLHMEVLPDESIMVAVGYQAQYKHSLKDNE